MKCIATVFGKNVRLFVGFLETVSFWSLSSRAPQRLVHVTQKLVWSSSLAICHRDRIKTWLISHGSDTLCPLDFQTDTSSPRDDCAIVIKRSRIESETSLKSTLIFLSNPKQQLGKFLQEYLLNSRNSCGLYQPTH